jgi:hypothetical protein
MEIYEEDMPTVVDADHHYQQQDEYDAQYCQSQSQQDSFSDRYQDEDMLMDHSEPELESGSGFEAEVEHGYVDQVEDEVEYGYVDQVEDEVDDEVEDEAEHDVDHKVEHEVECEEHKTECEVEHVELEPVEEHRAEPEVELEQQDLEIAPEESEELTPELSKKASSLAPLDEDVAMDTISSEHSASHEALAVEPSPLITPPTSASERELEFHAQTQTTHDVPTVMESVLPATENQLVSELVSDSTDAPKESIVDGSQSISRRSGPPHSKIRPNTIHGAPHSQSTSPFFNLAAAQSQLTYPTPSGVQDVQPTHQNLADAHLQSQRPSQVVPRTRRRSVKAPPSSPPPVIPARRDSLGVSVPIQLPPALQNGQLESHVSPTDMSSQMQLLAAAPIQASTPQSSSTTTSTHSRTRSGSYAKGHRKGPSSSGRFLGFLGGLSKKHGEPSSTQRSPGSPEGSHDDNLAEIDHESLLQQPSPHHISTTPDSRNGAFGHPLSPHQPSHYQYQYHYQQQQRGIMSSYEAQRQQSQRGKRRKTLSLVAGPPEHPIHHERQQPLPHHPLSVRPSPPLTDGSILASMNGLQPAQTDRSSGPAQRFMGWLRRKSIGKL